MSVKKRIKLEQISDYEDKYIKIEHITKKSNYSREFIKDCSNLIFNIKGIVKGEKCTTILLHNKNCSNTLGYWSHDIYYNSEHPFIYWDISDRIIII